MIYLKERIHMFLNVLIPSLCALCVVSFEPNRNLIDDSALDYAFILENFLYYLFAYYDIHTSL